MKKVKEYKFIIISFILIIIDQVSKILVVSNIYNESIKVIPNLLNFTYVENTGALFGIGKNKISIFIILNIIIIVLGIIYLIKNKDEFNFLSKISISMILSGGIGNLIDRIARGYVVDFIDVNPVIKWPMFNIADCYVVIGCILLFIGFILQERKEKNEGINIK